MRSPLALALAIPALVRSLIFCASTFASDANSAAMEPVCYFDGVKLQSGLNYPPPKIENGPTLTDERATVIQQGRSQLYCIGYVSYQDNAKRTRITGLCRVLTFPKDQLAHTGNARFRVFNDPDYEYED